MAKKVKFGKKSGAKKGGIPDFNFGFNAMSKSQAKAFRKKHGMKGGGS